MTLLSRSVSITLAGALFAPTVLASNLSYTFLDFQYIQQDLAIAGTQSTPGTGQTTNIVSEDGDGISVSGSVAIGDRFYVTGLFQSAIIDSVGEIVNPLGTTMVTDDFDLVSARFAFGYLWQLGDNFDVLFEVSFDSANYDFGSLAGEDFDSDGSGAGAGIGFRWNPVESFELRALGRTSSVAKVNLNTREFDSGSFFSTGIRWYFFEDLAIGLDFESGEVDTATFSLRFSFGRLPL